MVVRISLVFWDQHCLEEPGNVEFDGAAWELLYRIICEFFLPDSDRGLPVLSIPLRLSVSGLFLQKVAYMR